MMPKSDIDLVRENLNFRRNVIFSVSDHFAEHGNGLFDELQLAFLKEVILHAYLVEIATNQNRDEVDVFAAGALLLANFQPGLGVSGYSEKDVRKLLSTPLFQADEVSEADKKTIDKQVNFLNAFKASAEEREEISKKIQNAKYINSAIQAPLEKLRRSAWKIIRNVLRGFLFVALMIVALILMVLPAEKRRELLARPSDWFNRLSELPRYEGQDVWVSL